MFSSPVLTPKAGTLFLRLSPLRLPTSFNLWELDCTSNAIQYLEMVNRQYDPGISEPLTLTFARFDEPQHRARHISQQESKVGEILTLKFQNPLRFSPMMILKLWRCKVGRQLLKHTPSRAYV